MRVSMSAAKTVILKPQIIFSKLILTRNTTHQHVEDLAENFQNKYL